MLKSNWLRLKSIDLIWTANGDNWELKGDKTLSLMQLRTFDLGRRDEIESFYNSKENYP